jgi:prepilin-type processing-associated H-X9-DG protein
VELLVVITIIGILVGLLLPAVQYAREAMRRNQCLNNLKQWALGAQQHESVQTFYPSGGWGWSCIGDPDRGFGNTQPGGIIYNLLPYVDQGPLHDLGANIQDLPTRIQLAQQMIQTPLPLANCPTRRRPVDDSGWDTIFNYGGVPAPSPNKGEARTDYAGCCGDNATTDADHNTTELTNPEGGGPGASGAPGFPPAGSIVCPYTSDFLNGDFQHYTGVTFHCSQITAAQIKGGTDNTILLGEKYDCPADYYYGNSLQENENMYVGFDNDNYRITGVPPLHDRDTTDSPTMFGSAHADVVNFAFLDGHVRSLSYNIDLTTFQQLGRRVKTQAVDESKIH